MLAVTGVLTLVACGGMFRSSDCTLTHTCAPTNGGAEGGEDAHGDAASSSTSFGGASANGTGGPGSPCAKAGDCDNGDPRDGIETCAARRCVAGNLPPVVVAISPEHQAAMVDPDAAVVVEVSEELDEATVTADNVQLLDGGRPISGTLGYASRSITFTPDRPLPLLGRIEVVVTTDVADRDGLTLTAPFRSEFTVRDGAWRSVSVVAGNLADVSNSLPLDDDDRALLAWIPDGNAPCPATAAWFQRGAPLGQAKALTFSRTHYCRSVRTDVSSSGLGLVTWHEEDEQSSGAAMAFYRDGHWSPPAELNDRHDASGAVAATDSGVMHYLGPDGDVVAWTTTLDGKWPKTGTVLSPRSAVGEVRIAVAVNGDAVAAWSDQPASTSRQILAARYLAVTRSWTSAESLPGSLTTTELRGPPQVAFGPQQVPYVLWQRQSELVVSRFSTEQEQWSGPTSVSGRFNIPAPPEHCVDAPGLAFDGTTLVAAYMRLNGREFVPQVSRYDAVTDSWVASEGLSDTSTRALAGRMLQLRADRNGNLLVVWAASGAADGTYSLAFQRYRVGDGSWGGPSQIPLASFVNPDFESGLGRFVLGGNGRGAAAVIFSDGEGGIARGLNLASFD